MKNDNNTNHFFTSEGLKVIYAVDKSRPLVSLQLFIKMGAGFEGSVGTGFIPSETKAVGTGFIPSETNTNEAGYSHLLEHLVFKSTAKYPHNTLMDAVAMLGGNINAYTDHEVTCFYINLPSGLLGEGLDILYELAVNANFSKREFESERKVVIEEIKQCKNDPEDYFIDNLMRLVFKGHPYGRSILGNIGSLKAAKVGDLQAFYKRHYTAENMFLCVAGDFEVEGLSTIVGAGFQPARNPLSPWGKGGTLLCPQRGHGRIMRPHVDYITHNEIIHFPLPVDNAMLAFVLPSPADSHPDAHKLNCLDKIFAWGRNSRLYQRLYIKEKLIDSLKVQSITGIYDGALVILVQPRDNAFIQKIIEIFFEEMCEIVRFGVRSSEVEEARAELLHTCRYGYEYMEVLAQTIASEEILGDYRMFFEYEAQLEAVDKEGVNGVIEGYYDVGKVNVIVGGKSPFPSGKGGYLAITHRGGMGENATFGRILTERLPSSPTNCVRLPSGLRVFLKPTPSKGICGVTLSLYVSQLDEDPQTLGLNQLTTNLLLYGNEKRDYRQCLQYCNKNGIQISVSNGKEVTRLQCKCFTESLWESLDLLQDVLFTPTFPMEHINNLCESYISSIKKVSDFPQSEAVFRFKKMLFGSNSHLLSKTGSVRTLRTFTRKMILQWYREKVLGVPATLCIVGDFDVVKTLAYIENVFCNRRDTIYGVRFGQEIYHRPIYLSPSEQSVVKVRRDLDQSIISLGGFCMPGRDVSLRAPMNVLSQIIGGEIGSRMFSLLREKHAIAYSAEFDYDLLSDIGYFDMFTIVDRGSARVAVKLLYEMLEDLRLHGVTADEVLRAKKYLIGQQVLDEESVLFQSQMIATLLTLGMDYEYILGRVDMINGVSVEDVQGVVNEYFCGEDMYLHVLS